MNFALPVSAGELKLKEGEVPAEFAWTSTDGDSLTWAELRGEGPLVMVFWATWCAVCRKDWPKLQELQTAFADAPTPPAWASVSLGEPAPKVVAAIEKRGALGKTLFDPQEVIGKTLGIQYVPAVVVLDREGRVAFAGTPKVDRLKKLLSALTEAPASTPDSGAPARGDP